MVHIIGNTCNAFCDPQVLSKKPFETFVLWQNRNSKVQIFWEGHKNLAHLPLFIWHYLVASNYNWKMDQIFAAISEYLNFNKNLLAFGCASLCSTSEVILSKAVNLCIIQFGSQNCMQCNQRHYQRPLNQALYVHIRLISE